MREIGNAMSMYAISNHGSFPGPCLGQVRDSFQVGGDDLPAYLYKYFGLRPNADGSLTPAKVFFCPGYRYNNPGSYANENNVNPYHSVWYDPWIWTGYPVAGAAGAPSWPQYDLRFHNYITFQGQRAVPPMKVSQVWEPQRMVILQDVDNALLVYENKRGAGERRDRRGYFSAQAPFTSHGGRIEKTQGIQEIGMTPFWTKTPNYATARTDPPRNQLFVDGHVETVRRSDRILPPQFVKRYGPTPAGWFSFNALVN